MTFDLQEGSRSSGGQLSDSWGRGGNESVNSLNSSVTSSSSMPASKSLKHEKNSDKKKKGSYWYNVSYTRPNVFILFRNVVYIRSVIISRQQNRSDWLISARLHSFAF